jgi:RHH-type proline utilization regulon transcriptional repressor/proline dehydrogenase/delta 1-pyrroline-5-carboxylate dehydrogenase
MSRSLSPFIYADEAECVDRLLKTLSWDAARAKRVETRAGDLVTRMRGEKRAMGQLETFLKQYSLSTEEGLALMCLAEALLRIPDKATANDLIKDKIAAANWLAGMGDTKDWLVKAAGVGLMMTRKTLDSVLGGISQPVIREAILQAMRMMGKQFVLGQDIDEAIKNARDFEKKGYRFSYDILGEGARTAADAERYFNSYLAAIGAIGKAASTMKDKRPGLSVKLSALHPRYSFAQRERCVPEMTARLTELCKIAAQQNITLTVDAEEVDRLELSLDIIEGAMKQAGTQGWDGFGLAVQAYQKRALALIDHVHQVARAQGQKLQVRVVKGAYWDTEIKRAQVQGLADYPVYTRKVNTDVSFLACAQKLFAANDYLYPMLATHNAHSVAAIVDLAQGKAFEFQRLHGMGSSLHDLVLKDGLANVSVYAPVGPHEDLLAYLVRRLLENGANTSFVNQVLDDKIPAAQIVKDPVEAAKNSNTKRHSGIAMPVDLYRKEGTGGRANSGGFDLTDGAVILPFIAQQKRFDKSYEAYPLIDGRAYKAGAAASVQNPSHHGQSAGQAFAADNALIDTAMQAAKAGFKTWAKTPADTRASALEKAADLMEARRDELMALLIREAGKTYADGLAEVREAVDFLRYYANLGRQDFAETGKALPGPTGESNRIRLVGRGVFVCISPWNFPLAIFTGQVAAALMAGNAVVAKPASLTPLIAQRAVELMHQAGVSASALHLLPGSGRMGAALVAHPDVAGVTFTGSTAVAQEINRTLAAKNGPIVPLIAETGGLNAMIVDSSALPEQVIDDVIMSAFTSAGQRCSALRILCLQDDIADKVLHMLKGAMAELKIGPAEDLASDIGPLIDENARKGLLEHQKMLQQNAQHVATVPMPPGLENEGCFFAPCAYELKDLSALDKEVFGPILHVVRWKKDDLPKLVDALNGKGYGLTFGLHTRIDSAQAELLEAINAGNLYVNRSMIGAVVGTQPFGGMGLSGTGPKAGGPYYMHRFATEKTITINTTAAGGNATLVSLVE